MRKQLIVTADDFGLCVPVNEAVEQAHRDGVLTCASLMVTGSATEDAVARARRLPSLKVGLHIVVVEGKPILPAESVPALVDNHGELERNFSLAGLRFFFRPGARAQLEREIRAQFEAFRRTGLPLDHVNTHNHMHLHPTVLSTILRVGRDYGMKTMRVPDEPGKGQLLKPWSNLLRWRLRRHSILSNNRVLGRSDSGALTTTRAVELLANLPEGITEMYFHPATRRCPEVDRDMPHYQHEAELETLLSLKLKQAIEASGAELASYGDLLR
ncbi:MAG: hopanoid biosynthesis-associated protein HpnK [bacterium]|nr:hopanoid biosynthesis-associated protein HpnK [bacterium]